MLLPNQKLILPAIGLMLLFACNPAEPVKKKLTKPKLIVGVVVDQMRYDYLYRYESKFGKNGFRKLMDKGYNCANTHYNYIPTFTGPGHASIFTGTTPAVHGIIANHWYDKVSKKKVYCTGDTSMQTVGSTSKAGRMSSHRMMVPSIADHLRLSSNFKSKAFGVSLKDRGAILPAGHSANGAFWFDGATGNWITSSQYMNQLPDWAMKFNEEKRCEKLLRQDWNTLLPIDQYTESDRDDSQWEEPFPSETKPVFPHHLSTILDSSGYDLIKATPFGNTITKDFAISLIESEQLGQGESTDFISISFSSPDYVGHQFGPQSVEVEDTYLRLDQDIADLMAALDRMVGKDNYLMFLTADHGAAYNPSYLMENGIPGGNFNDGLFEAQLDSALDGEFGSGEWIESLSNEQVFLNHDEIRRKNTDPNKISESVVRFAMNHPQIAWAVTANQTMMGGFRTRLLQLAQSGYNQKRSGDILLILNCGVINNGITGTTHGSPFNYDTHVPLLWYGFGVKPGSTSDRVVITDIVPTLSAICKIQIPDGSSGDPIQKVADGR